MRLLARLLERQRQQGQLNPEDLRAVALEASVPLHRVQELVSFYPHFRRTPPARFELTVCRDMSCWMAAGSEQWAVSSEQKEAGAAHCPLLTAHSRLKERWAQQAGVEVREVSCLGRCDLAPAVCVNGLPARAEDVLKANDLSAVAVPARAVDSARRSWRCDPYEQPAERYGLIRELLGLERTAAAERVLAELKAAGLRGMGGAGFPTGTKWELVRKESRSPKYVICNADESEPGTFKDREVLYHLPHLVIEGMLLAGLVAGAAQGILFIRHEYEPEQHAFEEALAEARRLGLLGDEVLGSDFAFDIEVFTSPGGYILGEETALLEALEDRRGEPRNKPPFPGTHGLFGQPTLINNVETLALAVGIVRRGAGWWQAQGRPGFAGLKFMAVSGHVERPGVYEVPVGLTVRELIEQAGGVKDGRSLKAFAPGGASSNFLPAKQIDLPLDFAAVAKAGSMLGSGALVVVAEGTDMLALAANVVRFFRNESCGKCVPCRLGTEQAVRMLEEYLANTSAGLDVPFLHELAETLNLTSICGLGQVALSPLLSVLKHWPEEAGIMHESADNDA